MMMMLTASCFRLGARDLRLLLRRWSTMRKVKGLCLSLRRPLRWPYRRRKLQARSRSNSLTAFRLAGSCGT